MYFCHDIILSIYKHLSFKQKLQGRLVNKLFDITLKKYIFGSKKFKIQKIKILIENEELHDLKKYIRKITNVRDEKEIEYVSQFSFINHLEFGYYFNLVLKKEMFPKGLRYLEFGRCYNRKLEKNILPNTLTHLKLGHDFNVEIEPGVLPNSLQILEFDKFAEYNITIKQNVLPKNLKSLKFGFSFDKIIGEDVLPQNLKVLTFGEHYDQTIEPGVLPNSLEYLEFRSGFKPKIFFNALPNGLKYFKCSFLIKDERMCLLFKLDPNFKKNINYESKLINELMYFLK